MEMEKCIFTRKSVRRFLDKQLPSDIVQRIIEAGTYAPSACNLQAWKFIVVTDPKRKSVLKNAILRDAPVCMIVTYRNDIYVTGHKYHDYVQSAAAAIQNMSLYAHSIGIGSCWICDLPPQEVIRREFLIPQNFDAIACLALGYPVVGNENSEERVLYHFDSYESYFNRERKYSIAQVLCSEQFSTETLDCVSAQYGWKQKNEGRGRILNRMKGWLKRGLRK